MRRNLKEVSNLWPDEQKSAIADYTALEIVKKNGTGLLEQILHRDSLNAAWRKVKDNKGTVGIIGINGMTVDEMLPYLKGYREELLESGDKDISIIKYRNHSRRDERSKFIKKMKIWR